MPDRRISTDTNAEFFPNATTNEIVVQEIDNEILVYDVSNKKAHHLNETSTAIWRKCDGKTSVTELAEMLSARFGTRIDNDLVLLALTELQGIGLIDDFHVPEFDSVTRRSVLFKYAVPAVVLPLIMSLVTPAAVQAQSCLMVGEISCFETPCCPVNGLVCVPQNLPGNTSIGMCLFEEQPA